MLINWVRGLRSGFRLWRRQPGFALSVVAAATLGLAANAALFAVVDGVFLRPLPFRDADQLAHLTLAPQTFLRLGSGDRQRLVGLTATIMDSELFDGAAVFRRDQEIEAATALTDRWRGVRARSVSPNLFQVLGVHPVLGRQLSEADRSTTPRAVLISHELWTRVFGADAGIIGRVVDVPGSGGRGGCAVVGVMPAGFGFPEGTNLWIAERMPPFPIGIHVVARLSRQVTPAMVRTRFPELTVGPLRDYVRPENARMAAYLLLGSVCMSLVAWLQVGSLLLSRTLRRVTEFGLRIALGATPAQLRAECIGEATSLVATAVAAASGIAPALNALAVLLLPRSLTIDQPVTFEARGYVFLVALGVLGTIMLSLIPMVVVGADQARFATVSRTAGDSGTVYGSVRKALFVAQVSLATALVYLTTLVAVSYANVTSTNLGFNPSGLWALSLPTLEFPRGSSRSHVAQLASRHTQQVEATFHELAGQPDVQSIATSTFWPMRDDGIVPSVVRAERAPETSLIEGRVVSVSQGFVRTFGVEMVSGREMSDAEAATISDSASEEGDAFALVDMTLARHLEQYGPPVGQYVVVSPGQKVKVVGVVPDVRLGRPDERPVATVFRFLKSRTVGYKLIARAKNAQVNLAPVLRQTAQQVWGGRSTGELVRVQGAVDDANAGYRARAAILLLMVAFSVPIAALGLVGAVTHACADKQFEFAVRLALGCTPRHLRTVLTARFIGQAIAGLSAGVAIGVIIGRSMEAMLFGVPSADPRTIGGVVVVMAVVITVAIAIPSRRVASADALQALKQ